MVLVTLSSKGQLVLPKPVRQALGLRAGTQLYVQVQEDKIVLEPLVASPAAALHGKYPAAGFLADLEEEHRQEIHDEDTSGA